MVIKGFLIGLLVMSFNSVAAQKNHNLSKGKLAVQGYDVVSYFEDNAVKGQESIWLAYNGIIYYFSTTTNKKIFEGNPLKYIPKYGGWCAYAMGMDGSKVKVDPKTYLILNDQLYLFYNFGKTNTLTLWKEKEDQLQPSADRYWAEIED